jgi:iron complex transport system substrate-binding protein
MVGACDGASETVEWMDSRLSTVDAAVEDAERPDVIYSFFGFTAGEGTFIDTILERAGGNNVATDAGITSYQQLNEEILVDRNVDWLVLNSDDDQVPASAAYNSTTAVQEGQVVVVDTNHLNRPAPRVVYAVSQLGEAFHPDAYAAANATVTATPGDPQTATATATATADTGESTPSPTRGESGPWFGIGASWSALLAVVALAARHR